MQSKEAESNNTGPNTSYYKRMDYSNGDHIHLTQVSGAGFDKSSRSSNEPLPNGIRVQRDVDIV